MDEGHGEDIGDGVKQLESYDVGSNFKRLPGQIPWKRKLKKNDSGYMILREMLIANNICSYPEANPMI